MVWGKAQVPAGLGVAGRKKFKQVGNGQPSNAATTVVASIYAIVESSNLSAPNDWLRLARI